jgi:hypothetical protein
MISAGWAAAIANNCGTNLQSTAMQYTIFGQTLL